MAPRMKRRPENPCESPITCTLPADLMLEIAARSEPHVLVRFAAACKLLRRDILSPCFIRRVSHEVAPYILADLRDNEDEPFTLVHPVSPAITSFCQGQLFPFFSRHTASLFDKYDVVTSRRGLVLLRRHMNMNDRPYSIMNRPNSDRCSELCVYDPMSGTGTFLPLPPKDGGGTMYSFRKYVLLTAVDGIDDSFQVLVANHDKWSIKVRIASSHGIWSSETHVINHDFLMGFVERRRSPVVLHGGIIHWLVHGDKQILRYDLGTRKRGSVKFPNSINCHVDQIQLAASSDGKLLKLLAIEGFMLSVWLQVSVSAAGGCGWSLETVIDMEGKLRSLHPNIPPNGLRKDYNIVFDDSQKRSGDVVFLWVRWVYPYSVTVFDLETKDMHTQEWGLDDLLEIDLPSRLEKMKIFS